MRFELGDTATDGEELTCPLCDEEYTAIIQSESNWKRAKLKCLGAIAMKINMQFDSTSIGGLSYANGQRAERWLQMHKDLKKELTASKGIPLIDEKILSGEPYFHKDMHKNHYRSNSNGGGRP